MAKNTSSSKIAKPHDNSNSDLAKEAETEMNGNTLAIDEGSLLSVDELSADEKIGTVAAKPIEPSSTSAPLPPPREKFDSASLTNLGGDLERQLKASVDAFESAGRTWVVLVDQLANARSEIDRLHAVEAEYAAVSTLLTEEKGLTTSLQAELTDLRASKAAATDKAAKLEEAMETIKQRAFEIHTALQQARGAEEKAQAELANLRRVAQDEEAARVSAQDHNTRLLATVSQLEAAEVQAHQQIAKLMQDNKAMASHVPQLLADRDKWQKQFQASERENARMSTQREIADTRIGELEAEIKMLRSDLASLPSSPALAIPGEQGVEEKWTDHDDLDLAASLERAFVADEEVKGLNVEPARPS